MQKINLGTAESAWQNGTGKSQWHKTKEAWKVSRHRARARLRGTPSVFQTPSLRGLPGGPWEAGWCRFASHPPLGLNGPLTAYHSIGFGRHEKNNTPVQRHSPIIRHIHDLFFLFLFCHKLFLFARSNLRLCFWFVLFLLFQLLRWYLFWRQFLSSLIFGL